MVKGILVNRKSDESLKTQFKMEHADLVAEMQTVENLPTHERLQLARLRRAQQLKVGRQKEKEWVKLQRAKGYQMPPNGSAANTTHHFRSGGGGAAGRHISFENSVVLLEAASRNDMQEVAELLKHGITPDAANEDGLTALHQCCIDNNVEMLKLLLEFGANVDAQDSDKWTPLHAAATCGHLDLVRILIDRGANLLAVNTDGNMPYDLCDDENTLDFIEAEMSKRGVTQELIDETRSSTEQQMLRDLTEVTRNGGDLEEPDYQGATPLHIAAANGYVHVVEFLLEMHVNVDALDKDMWSPVHAAACWGHMEVLEMLAQCGADLNVKNKDDETPSDICEDPEIRERIEQLKSEQETKRLAEAQRRRVRRSQSNNTRAQSVRRTSLRDKTLTTKKDAVEEARLRLQAQEVFTTPGDANGYQQQSPKVGVDEPALDTGAGAGGGAGGGAGDGDAHAVNSDPAANSRNWLAKRPMNSTTTAATATATAAAASSNNNNSINTNNNNNNNNNNDKKSFQASLALSHSMSADAVDTTAYSASFTPRRPPDGRENDELQMSAYKHVVGGAGGPAPGEQQRSTSATAVIVTGGDVTSSAAASATAGADTGTEAVQIQSSKEAANGKINVQVTVLVDTTSTHHHHHQQQLQLQQQQQQQHQQHQQQHQQQQQLPQQQQQQAQLLDSAFAGATLANLKKQRSLSRTNILNYENGSVLGAATTNTHTHTHTNSNSNSNAAVNNNNNNNSLLSDGHTAAISSQPLNNNVHGTPPHLSTTPLEYGGNSLPPASADNSAYSSLNKFSGVTGDVVSDSTSSKKCCLIM